MLYQSICKLEKFLIKEEFKGYDPYDTLNSWIPFRSLGTWFSSLATQFQKRNPINIRPLLGINKSINPKAFGLFLKSYSMYYNFSGNQEHLLLANRFFNYLYNNYSTGYSGYCWGYNFPWSSPGKFVDKYLPNAVTTSFIIQGMYQYYLVTRNQLVKEIVSSASEFITNDLPITKDRNGVCISYTPLWRDLCLNASLLSAEILAFNFALNGNEKHREIAQKALDWVVFHQKSDGRWNYSIDPVNGNEREQIDFHQGYILVSMSSIIKTLNLTDSNYQIAINKGLRFYKEQQFFPNGISKWRIPKIWPVDIHNQSQGILTFSLFKSVNKDFVNFSRKIAEWTISNMQDPGIGFFFYKKERYYSNRIPFIRWSQAWMLLALLTLYTSEYKNE